MLEIDGLSKRYGDVVALREATFTAARGRLVGFVGPNGAGKSTTMRSVFGLVAPDDGVVRWEGRPTIEIPRSVFGYLPEQRGLYPKMKIGEQVQYFAELKGIGRADARARAEAILISLDLDDRLGDSLEALSHGNQQRVQLAVALVHEPDLLILDEPFSGLDPVAVDVLQEVLRDRVTSGAAVLFSSHQLDLVEQLCDDIVVIADGTIRATGTVRDVRRSTNQQLATVEVASPTSPLDSVMGHLHVLDNRVEPDGRQVIRLSLKSTSELGAVVAAARQVGDLLSLTYEPPTLSEIFKEIVQ